MAALCQTAEAAVHCFSDYFCNHGAGQLLKDVDWHRVGIGLASQSPIHVLMMLIGGCISIVPMLGYDFAITHFLSGRFSKHYIIRSGWITNTLTNVAGFGGLLGATLRAYFYGKHSSKNRSCLPSQKLPSFYCLAFRFFVGWRWQYCF